MVEDSFLTPAGCSVDDDDTHLFSKSVISADTQTIIAILLHLTYRFGRVFDLVLNIFHCFIFHMSCAPACLGTIVPEDPPALPASPLTQQQGRVPHTPHNTDTWCRDVEDCFLAII